MVMGDRRDFLQLGGRRRPMALAGALDARAADAQGRSAIGGRRMRESSTSTRIAFSRRCRTTCRTSNMPRAPLPTSCSARIGSPRMDERGIDVQALSINHYWWYAASRDAARGVVAMHDEGFARGASAPDRFVALSSVALQFPISPPSSSSTRSRSSGCGVRRSAAM